MVKSKATNLTNESLKGKILESIKKKQNEIQEK